MIDYIKQVQNKMIGRIAMEHGNSYHVLEAAKTPGNYLEIGILHGGTLIAVALMRKDLGIQGRIVGLDPLNGYYSNNNPDYLLDPITKIPVTLDTVVENAERLGVLDMIEIIQKKSYPFPDELQEIVWSTVYIDGNHWDYGPIMDWFNVEKYTSDNVIFDNFDKDHPDVVSACTIAMGHRDWHLHLKEGITFWLRNE